MSHPNIRLTQINRLAQDGRWRVEAMRSYSSDQLIWFTRGQGRITVSGVTRGYGTHNAVFVPAGAMHSFEMTSHVFGMILSFAPGHGLSLPLTPLHLRIRDGQAQAELTGHLEAIQREQQSDSSVRDMAMLHHAGLISVWLHRQMAQNDDALAVTDAARRLVRKYSVLVEQDFRSPNSVSHYAKILGVTPTHLTRACKETCGRTASEFLSNRKVAEARRLLADTKTPVKDIAQDLGFTSPAYFTRAFSTKTGMSPLVFRRSEK